MNTNIRRICLLTSALVAFSGSAVADDAVRTLTWDDLMPPQQRQIEKLVLPPHVEVGEEFDWEEDSFEEALATPVYPAGVIEELDGQQVKLPGFIVPLELQDKGKVIEFLLVPYFGACIHYPAPPPNQVVYVTLSEAVEVDSMYDPVWLTGELRTESRYSEMGSAGYTMKGMSVEAYEY